MPSPSLSAYIEGFSDYISSGDASALAPYLAENANPEFLKIYRNGAFKACLDALTANFPTLKQYLEDEAFKGLGREYISQHWPQDSRLAVYGEHLVEFMLDAKTDYPAHGIDFARLDRAWLDALFARDESPLSGEDIAAIVNQDGESHLHLLTLASSVRLAHLDHHSLPRWIKYKFESDVESDQNESKSIMFWRREQIVQYRQLDMFEESFITTVSESGSIMQAAETAIAIDPNEDISTLFAGLLTAGVLIKKAG